MNTDSTKSTEPDPCHLPEASGQDMSVMRITGEKAWPTVAKDLCSLLFLSPQTVFLITPILSKFPLDWKPGEVTIAVYLFQCKCCIPAAQVTGRLLLENLIQPPGSLDLFALRIIAHQIHLLLKL